MEKIAKLKGIGETAFALLRTGLFQRSGIYFSATIFNSLIPFLLLPVLARALGPTNYGVVGSLTAMVNLAVIVVGLSTHGILTPLYFQEDRQTFVNSISACLVVLIATTPCLALVFVLFGPEISRLTGVTPQWQWTITASAVGQFAIALTLVVFRIRGDAIKYGILQVSNTAFNIFLSVVLVVGYKWNWEGRALAQVIATLVFGLIGIGVLRSDYEIFQWPEWSNIKRAIRFGAPLIPHLSATIARSSLDRVIIGAMLGFAQAGRYFVVFQIASVLTLVCSSINQAWAPWLFRRLASGNPESRNEVVRVTYCVLAAYVAAAVVLMFAGPVLIPLLVGKRFGDAGNLLWVLAPAAAFNGGYFLFTNYIFFVQRTEWLAAISVGLAILQGAMTVPMIHFFGIWGAAWTAFFGGALFMGIVWISAEYLFPMGWFAWFQRRESTSPDAHS